ncbi:hypothetical protein J2S28_003772 [Rhizobium sp. SLBN-94]|nr:hypothetical protein [Rhizobium sp. SLBN-94]
MRAIVLLLVGFFTTPSYGQGSVGLGPNSNEHPFQCGAAFAIMAKVYKEAGDAKKSADYRTKFDKLAAQAEGIFEKSHRSKGDAQAYMQKHVDSLTAVAEKDATLVINFTQRCDQRFPS